jgi:hypothetical protein
VREASAVGERMLNVGATVSLSSWWWQEAQTERRRIEPKRRMFCRMEK